MQLKLKRSQRDGGLTGTTAVFCLDARVEFAPEERDSILRYRLQRQIVYNSDAHQRLLDRSLAQQDGSLKGNLKSLATALYAFTKLHISVADLEQGKHIECKSLDELLGAEDAIMTACQNLRCYLDTAITFDGREMLVDFSTGEPVVVAQTGPMSPLLAAPADMPVLGASPDPTAAGPPSAEAVGTLGEPEVEVPYSDPIIDWFLRLSGNPLQLFALIAGIVLLGFLLQYAR